MKLEEHAKDKPLFKWSYTGQPCTFNDLRIQVGLGWEALLSETFAKLFALGWTGGVSQIKEKYGTLCLYLENECEYPDIASDVIDVAEWRSGQICEQCGAPGRLRGTGWLYTACNKCHEARQKKYNGEKGEAI